MGPRSFNQVERNYEAFRAKLYELLPVYGGKFALMKDGEIVDFFDTAMDAYAVGKGEFGVGRFSIQEVVDDIVDLGYFSHVLPQEDVQSRKRLEILDWIGKVEYYDDYEPKRLRSREPK